MRRGRFRWSGFFFALVVSLAWHLGYVIPHVIEPLIFKPEPAEIEIAYEPDLTPSSDDKSQPTPPEPLPPLDEQARRERVKEKKLSEAPKTPPPEVAQVVPPKPVAPPPPVVPPPPPPPQPMPKPDHRMQMVSQTQYDDEKDNADAHYLGEKNHRAEKETRAEATNLLREVQSPHKSQSEESSNRDAEVGGKDEKIAELESHQGPDKTLPRSSLMSGAEGTRTAPERAGPLSMRNLLPKAAIDKVQGEKPRDGLDKQEEGTGNMPMARIGRDSQRGVAAQKGGKVKLQLDHHNYDNIEGFATAEKERQAGARAEASHKRGRYDKYLAQAQALRSSLENFTPDVKPGNQAELGTRASPFAAYITAMHRQIHKLWTFGFLADIEARPNSLYANEELWTQLEIVLKGDGTVDKVNIVRSSGLLPFDAVAIDSVMSAAPFPTPPQVIRSANGKVYMDWQFHRNELACGTFNVDPHILTTPGDNTEHDTSVTGAAALARAHQQVAGPRALSRTPSTQRTGREEEQASVRPAEAVAPVVPEVTPEARTAAESWFDSYARGDAAWLAGWSAAPFTAGGEIVAKDGAAVKSMYKQLMAEAAARREHGAVDVLTPAGIRGRLGGLPPGGEESGMLYAVAKAGKDELILLLKQSSQGWRVCGLDR